MSAVPVVIVQDNKSNRELFVMLFSGIITLLVKAWLVMLLIGSVADWGLSYWQVLVAVAILGAIQSDGDAPWKLYTRSAGK